MPVKNPKELFVTILSQVRHGTERSAAIYKELGELAQNSEIQEALEARTFVSQQTLAKLDEAFKIIGEKPVNVTGRLHDVFVEDFRRGEAALRIGKGQSLEPHAHGGIRYVGRGRRCFRSPWRRCAARELPRRPFGLRRPDEAFNPSCHRSEGRGESYRLSCLIGERREEISHGPASCEAGPYAWFRGQSQVCISIDCNTVRSRLEEVSLVPGKR